MAATAACAPNPPPPIAGKSHPASRPASSAGGPATAALARQGLLLPTTYQQACATEASICLTTTGRIPGALDRPLHFPVLRPGQACPATHGRWANTASFGGIALGTGPVRPIADGLGSSAEDRRGTIVLLRHTNTPPWLAAKTLWFSVPAYQGPFVIRAKRLDGRGPIAMGEAPRVAPLVVPPGPTLNGRAGWREAPGSTWVMAPGCYAW